MKKTPFINNNNESDSELSISESVLVSLNTIYIAVILIYKKQSDAVISKGRRGHTSSATPRKKRDPNAPKGPGNVFFLYCRMERDNIKDEVPNESLGEVTRLLGQKWKALTKEEKQVKLFFFFFECLFIWFHFRNIMTCIKKNKRNMSQP